MRNESLSKSIVLFKLYIYTLIFHNNSTILSSKSLPVHPPEPTLLTNRLENLQLGGRNLRVTLLFPDICSIHVFMFYVASTGGK